ncbi:unnamed protein product [Ceutorhynchus assimilis]|uniref:Essential protein Yae1 N-terminal domain-containing protein n=1 Tax=Ceutorhynchus assimilis TaxID=467358 RepID=A0A9N9MLR0_9CUCU|nr:unnamed protein product [Ceutorhynchus assimilis]
MDLEGAEIEPDWKKVERDMIKVGLKNGLSDGRDSNFQKSFDTGYKDGFRNGYELGKLQFQRTQLNRPVSAQTTELLQNTSTGMCVACTSEKDNEDVADVRRKQNALFGANIEKINRDFNKDNLD